MINSLLSLDAANKRIYHSATGIDVKSKGNERKERLVEQSPEEIDGHGRTEEAPRKLRIVIALATSNRLDSTRESYCTSKKSGSVWGHIKPADIIAWTSSPYGLRVPKGPFCKETPLPGRKLLARGPER